MLAGHVRRGRRDPLRSRRSSRSGSGSSRRRERRCSRSCRRSLAGTWNQRRYGNLAIAHRGRRRRRRRSSASRSVPASSPSCPSRRCGTSSRSCSSASPRSSSGARVVGGRATLIRRDPLRRRGRQLPSSPAGARRSGAAATQRNDRGERIPPPDHDPGPGHGRRSAISSGRRRRRRTSSRSSTRPTAPSPASAARAPSSSPRRGPPRRRSRSPRRSSSRSSTARSSPARSPRPSPPAPARARSGAESLASEVQGLRALGRDIPSTPGASASLEDWGTLTVLSGDSGSRKAGPPGAQASMTALRVNLSAAHGGLPAGSEIVIGSAQADGCRRPRRAPPSPWSRPGDRPTRRTPRSAPARARAGRRRRGRRAARCSVAPEVSAQLSSGGFVFPVYGTASFGDSFGGPRPNIPGGWHHGEDIFAAAGTPLLAVADGTLHTIGFNQLGGYRLWLRDTEGNEFYYAHLSAYSPLAVEGRSVEAGDVIGFVGDTGDADGGSPHLHFEIHPAVDGRARLRRCRRAVLDPARVATRATISRSRPGGSTCRRDPAVDDAAAARCGPARGRRHRLDERSRARRARESAPDW